MKTEITKEEIQKIKEKYLLLTYDLWFFRYKKPGKQWYELTDYLRDNMIKEGLIVEYDDKEKTVYVFDSANGKFPMNISYRIKEGRLVKEFKKVSEDKWEPIYY